MDKKVYEAVKSFPCIVHEEWKCGGGDAHHVQTRGANGPDAYWNLLPLCREAHQEVHRGFTTFVKKNPGVAHWLKKMGWEFDDYTKRWWHPKQKRL